MTDTLNPEFDLHDSKPSQLNVVNQMVEVIYPNYMAHRWPGSTTFTIAPSSTFFTDSKILMKMVFRIIKKSKSGEEGNIKAEKDEVTVVNNFLSSAWSTVQLTINGAFVTSLTRRRVSYTFYYRRYRSKSGRRSIPLPGLPEIPSI